MNKNFESQATSNYNDSTNVNLNHENEDDVIPFNLINENFSAFYDIDGLSGFACDTEVYAFKSLLNLNFCKKNKKRPITKNKYVLDRCVVRELKNILCIHFAELNLPTPNGERIELFFAFNLDTRVFTRVLSEEDETNIRNNVHDTILYEIRETIASKRIKHCKMSFKKGASNNQVLIQSDKFSDVIDSDCTLNARIDNTFLYNILKQINENLPKNIKATVFFESYSTKNIFTDLNLEFIVEKFKSFIDLSLLNVEFDVCCNIGAQNLDEKTVFCPEDFFSNEFGLNYYYLFNCSDFATYHGHTIKRNSPKASSGYVKLFTNGISKVNIYSPLLTQYLPRSFRNFSFPCYTSELACTNFYNWSFSKKSSSRIQKLCEQLKIAKLELSQNLNLEVDMRAEFRISSINIPVFTSFIKKIFVNKVLRYCETKKLIYRIQQGIDGLLNRLLDKNNCTLESIAKLGVYEIYYFERFIGGGHNLHILPNSLKEEFLKGKNKTKIAGIEEFNSLHLRFFESHHIIDRLIKYNTRISEKLRNMMSQIIECIRIDYESLSVNERSSLSSNYCQERLNKKSMVMNLLVESFLKTICSTYKIDESTLYVGSVEVNSKGFNVIPMTFSEIVFSYFSNPAKKFVLNLYFGLYKYLSYDRQKSAYLTIRT